MVCQLPRCLTPRWPGRERTQRTRRGQKRRVELAASRNKEWRKIQQMGGRNDGGGERGGRVCAQIALRGDIRVAVWHTDTFEHVKI